MSARVSVPRYGETPAQYQDRMLADYISRVGEHVGREHYHKFLACMTSVINDYRTGRDAEDLAKEIVEHG